LRTLRKFFALFAVRVLVYFKKKGTQCSTVLNDVPQCCEIEKYWHIYTVKLLFKHCETLWLILTQNCHALKYIAIDIKTQYIDKIKKTES
jgi:hypothetical protein